MFEPRGLEGGGFGSGFLERGIQGDGPQRPGKQNSKNFVWEFPVSTWLCEHRYLRVLLRSTKRYSKYDTCRMVGFDLLAAGQYSSIRTRMKFFIYATHMVLPNREGRYANFSFENTHANTVLSLLDANCCLLRYLILVLEQWPGWPAGDPQRHRNTGTCTRGHGWIFLFRLKSHMHFSYTRVLEYV